MIASDIVTQLRLLLPQLTDKFTDDIDVSAIGRSTEQLTVWCRDIHNLELGQYVQIMGAKTPIDVDTFTRVGTVGTIVTLADHDLTLPIATTVTTTNVTAKFKGTFNVIDVLDRRTITVEMTDADATSATGGTVVDIDSVLNSYNGIYEVKGVEDPAKFILYHSDTTLANPLGDEIVARVRPRISSGVNIVRCMDAYTKHSIDKYWAFVILGDVNASQSRLIGSDAISNIQRGSEYRQQLIQPFTVYVVMPVNDEIAASESRDEASNLLRPMLRSLLFSKFDSGLYAGALNPVQFIGHSVYDYNAAIYVHAYDFQQVADVYFQDTVGDDLDVAFRDLTFDIHYDFGTQVSFLRGSPKLDEA